MKNSISLTNIVEAAEVIRRYVGGVSREEFLANEMMCDAVLRCLTRIGEASARLS